MKLKNTDFSVLVVEDDNFQSFILTQILKSIDPFVKVTHVYSAERAQLQLNNMDSAYSLIIADYGLLGKKTGLSLWRECQAAYPQMPFVMISALSLKSFRKMIGEKEEQPLFLSKPFFAREFREVVKWLDL
jgi:CheY-like chemotaxis protein